MESKMIKKFIIDGKDPDCPIIDIHGHMGNWRGIYFPYAGPRQMIKRMDMAGVRLVVFSHHSAISSPDILNSKAIEAVKKFPERFKAYCVINPHYPDLAEKELESYEKYKDIYAGIKLHADFHNTSYDNELYRETWNFADKKSLPVLVHSWGDSPLSNGRVIRAIAEKYSKAKIIMGHSLHDRWSEAADIACRYDNIYLDLCAVLDERAGILEKFVNAAGAEKVLFGTDIPWFSFHYYIGGILAADISDEDRHSIFYGNAVKLLNLEYLHW